MVNLIPIRPVGAEGGLVQVFKNIDLNFGRLKGVCGSTVVPEVIPIRPDSNYPDLVQTFKDIDINFYRLRMCAKLKVRQSLIPIVPRGGVPSLVQSLKNIDINFRRLAQCCADAGAISAIVTAGHLCHQALDQQSDGTRWVAYLTGASPDQEIKFVYSQDGGTTWTAAATTITTSNLSGGTAVSIYIDADDYLHVIWISNSGGASAHLEYERGTPNGTNTDWSWQTSTTLNGSGGTPLLGRWQATRFIVVRNPSGVGWSLFFVSQVGSAGNLWFVRVALDASGVPTVSLPVTALGGIAPVGAISVFGLGVVAGFARDASNAKVATASPDIFFTVNRDNNALFTFKVAYTGSDTWATAATVRATGTQILTTTTGFNFWVSSGGVFDNAFTLMPVRPQNTSTPNTTTPATIYKRNAANTTTTTLAATVTPPANNFTQSGHTIVNDVGDIWLVMASRDLITSERYVNVNKYTAVTTSWGGWATVGSNVLLSTAAITAQLATNVAMLIGAATPEFVYRSDAGDIWFAKL